MQKWLIGLAISILQDRRVQAWVKNMITVAAASAAKSAVDELTAKIPGVEGVVDAAKVANDTRVTLDRLFPDFDTGIKPIDDIMDIWRPKH